MPAQDWMHWPWQIQAFTERLQGVVIENKDAEEIIAQHDSPVTVFYADPPYVQSTRSSLRVKNGNRGHYYRCEMTDADHRRLAEVLHLVNGMVLLSGYASELYAELYADWPMLTRRHMADGAREREEVLWISPNALTQRRLAEVVNG